MASCPPSLKALDPASSASGAPAWEAVTGRPLLRLGTPEQEAVGCPRCEDRQGRVPRTTEGQRGHTGALTRWGHTQRNPASGLSQWG